MKLDNKNKNPFSNLRFHHPFCSDASFAACRYNEKQTMKSESTYRPKSQFIWTPTNLL